MLLEVATLVHSTFRLQLGLSENTTWLNSYGSSRRGGPGFVAAAWSWDGDNWGALACSSCQSAAKVLSDPDPSIGSEECTILGLSETEKNHIPILRLISDQAGKGFCLQCVPLSVQLCSDFSGGVLAGFVLYVIHSLTLPFILADGYSQTVNVLL